MDKKAEIDKILRRIQVNAEMIHNFEKAAERLRIESAELRARRGEIEKPKTGGVE